MFPKGVRNLKGAAAAVEVEAAAVGTMAVEVAETSWCPMEAAPMHPNLWVATVTVVAAVAVAVESVEVPRVLAVKVVVVGVSLNQTLWPS